MLSNLLIGFHLTTAILLANPPKDTEKIIYVGDELPVGPSDYVTTISGKCKDFSFSIEYSLRRNTDISKNYIIVRKNGKLLSKKIQNDLSNILINRNVDNIDVWLCRSFEKVNLLIFVSMTSIDFKSDKLEYRKIVVDEYTDSAYFE